MKNKKLKWLYTCPKCGGIILKSNRYIDRGIVEIKCQKCKIIVNFNEIKIKRV